MAKTQVSLYLDYVSDMRKTLDFILTRNYDSITTHIVDPSYPREFDELPMKKNHIKFSRSDLILPPADWLHRVISKLSENIDCDSPDESYRRLSERTLIQELEYAEHLVQHGYVMLKLNSQRCVNFARTVTRNIKGLLLIELPMMNPKLQKMTYRRDKVITDLEALQRDDNTWNWWNTFRSHADFSPRVKVALELSDDLPADNELARWLGEPVEYLIVPSKLFIRNASNYPVLKRVHQDIVGAFVRNNCTFIVKASLEDGGLQHYSDYLRHLADKYKLQDPMHGFDDVLEIPLQPLYDNLDSYTYEVFERDPIKYLYYQKAIEAALVDLVPEEEIQNRTVIIMVVGAGRGPLVRAAINATENTSRKTKIYVIEKNPNAVITLAALVEEMWSDKNIEIISTDMRDFEPPEKADILVSELLGSFGDNELSPECLDGAQKHLKPDGISIPCESTSHLNPVMSSKIFNLVRLLDRSTNPRERNHSYATQAESTYVVYMKNVYHIADPQPLFRFVHPNRERHINNERFKTLTFEAELDCVLHGFTGYFDCVLYKDITLSIHPYTHSKGLSSWFSVFFPVAEPQQVKAGDVIEVNFWRCVSSHKVWYEWSTSRPIITHIHNHNGRSCPIYK